MHTLVTFLGSARLDPRTGYRTARYRFENGTEEETPFFGLALARRIRPDRVLVLGTSGSSWPALVEHAVHEGAEEARLALIEASERGQVTQALLDSVQPIASRALALELRLRVVPYAVDEREQREILAIVGTEIRSGEASFDVTHGLRHLALLGQLSAFMLAHARRLRVRSIWYGALELTREGITPVVRLDGLLAIERWLTAFVHYEASGDPSPFAELLERDGVPSEIARRLKTAGESLSMNQTSQAAREIRALLDRLAQPLRGASELFRERLRGALRWAAADRLSEQQRLLALQSLQRRDFLRAAIHGIEAVVSREAESLGLDPEDFDQRERARERLEGRLRLGSTPTSQGQAYWLLRNVRNAFAHGTRPTYRPHLELLRNPRATENELGAALNRLLNS